MVNQKVNYVSCNSSLQCHYCICFAKTRSLFPWCWDCTGWWGISDAVGKAEMAENVPWMELVDKVVSSKAIPVSIACVFVAPVWGNGHLGSAGVMWHFVFNMKFCKVCFFTAVMTEAPVNSFIRWLLSVTSYLRTSLLISSHQSWYVWPLYLP